MKHIYAKLFVPLLGMLLMSFAALAQPTFEVINKKDACNGLINGSFEVIATGGEGPFSLYVFGVGKNINGVPIAQNTPYLVDGLGPYSFIVVVTDKFGNGSSQIITIGNTTGVTIDNASLTNNSCTGAASGSIDLTVSGGSGSYRYSLDGGATYVAEPIAGLAGGTYTVTVYDANTNCSTTATYTIEDALTLTTSSPLNFCEGDNNYALTDAITTNVAGGTFTFSGTGVDGSTFSPGDAGPGSYTINIVYTVNGCSETASIIANVTAAPTVEAALTAVSCFGEDNGAIDLTITGVAPPYSVSWSNGATSENLTGLVAGTYTVTVEDANTCAVTKSFTITQPVALSATAGVENVSCNGAGDGSITVSINGGTAPYAYSWSNGTTAEALTDLVPGVYTLTVTDLNGCTLERSYTITEPDVLTLTLTQTANVSCTGATDAAINLSVSGGTPAYSYVWSNGVTTQDLSSIGAGTYSVTVTDVNGCSETASIIIEQPTPVLLTWTVQDATTCGGAEGSIDLSVSGGTAPYTYAWAPGGAITEDISGLSAGVYAVTVTDNNGCSAAVGITVGEPAGISSLDAAITPVSCFGTSTGEIDLVVVGGTAPYTYLWSNSATSEDLTGLAAGTYSVEVTDATNCKATASFVVSEPEVLAASGSATNVTCFGANDGTITLNVSGGTAPYTYVWSHGAATEDLTALAPGTYSVVITDARGCTTSQSYTILDGARVELSATLQQVLCNGASTGAIDLSVSGGTAPYTYSWSNTSSEQDLENIGAGTYEVTVTDAAGCLATASYTITAPPALSLKADVTHVTTCNGTNGEINLRISGGVSPFTYVWSNGAVTEDLTGLSADTYSVTVTDANNCTATVSAVVTQPAGITAVEGVLTQVSCNGGSTGAIDISVTGGTAPYTYNWSNGASTQDISELVAGTYTVLVTDINSCTFENTFIITAPAAIELSAALTQLSCAGVPTGEINLTVRGGTAPYTYNWSNGSTEQDLTGLSAGTYTIIVTDANACTATAAYTITAPAEIVAAAAATNVSCNGTATGSIDLEVSGGTPAYTYLWNNGATTQDLENVVAGTYSVTITDAAGCTATASATITQPTVLRTNITGITTVCPGATNAFLRAAVSGGTSPYTYSWSTGATTARINNLGAGTFTVLVTDARGCIVEATATIVEQNLVVNLGDDVIACDASPVVLKSGYDAGNYTIAWSTGENSPNINVTASGTYTVTVTDRTTGCSGTDTVEVTFNENVEVSATLTTAQPLSCTTTSVTLLASATNAGDSPVYQWSVNGEVVPGVTGDTYTLASFTDGTIVQVQVTSSVTCTTGPDTAEITLNKVPTPAVTATITDVACYGTSTGAIDLAVSNGTEPYSYSWSNGSTSEDLIDVAADTYTVTITDGTGCEVSATYTITEPAEFTVATAVTNLSGCSASDGAIAVEVSGGVAPYSYSWSNGSTDEDLSNLAAGTYTIIVTDANGCTATASATVAQPAVLELTLAATNATSCGGDQGALDLTISGGVAPYSYSWSNGTTEEDLTGLMAGDYTVEVTDANGCVATASATITEPNGITSITAATTDVSCNGTATGVIDASVNGGVAPYSYSWSNGATTEDIADLAAGEYTLTVRDANGCSAVQTFIISQPDALSATGTAQATSSCGAADGAVALTVAGGTAPYTYLWSNNTTAEDLSAVVAGSYSVVIIDANGCTLTETFSVNDGNGPVLSAELTNASCFDAATGAISLSVTGGVAPYSYSWSNGSTDEDLVELAAGTFSVTVTDANGCVAAATYTITEPAEFTVATAVTNLSGCSASDGAIAVEVSGGVAPYSYSWSNGSTDEDLSNLAAGTYTIIVTDANGCTATASATVAQPAVLELTLAATNATSCGGAEGALALTVTGGVEPYSYSWSNGATEEDLTGLMAGDYTVEVTDANGCVATASATLTEPNGITSITATTTNVSCNGTATGVIDASVNGGVAPYSYSWSNGATTEDIADLAAGEYTLTVRDANGCSAVQTFIISQPDALSATGTAQATSSCGAADGAVALTVAGGTAPYSYLWSNNTTAEDLSAVVAGSYSVVVTDANGCTLTETFSVNDGNGPVLSAELTNASCFGAATGAISLSNTGGVAPYSYSWSNGSTDEDLVELAAGTYSVTVTDANGCVAAATYTITEPAEFTVATAVTNLSGCSASDGAITVEVSGGVAPYSYSWSSGSTDEDLSNLSAGTYTILVTDANGCTATASATVAQPAVLELTLAVTNATSCGGDQGALDLTISGGVAPYSYNWSNGTTEEDLTGLMAGDYTVEVTDANGCVATASATITEPNGITSITATTTDVTCNGTATGAIDATVNGGVAPYSYSWSNGATTEDITALAAGEYTLTVRDANGCSAVQTFIISQPDALVLTAEVQNTSACAAADGAIVLTVTGGAATYTYNWSNGEETQNLANLVAGTYSVTVTDTNGCTATASFAVSDAVGPEVTATVVPAACGAANGSIDLSVSGGTDPYSYSWNNGATEEDLTDLAAGLYTVLVQDANGCSTTATFEVGQSSEVNITVAVTNVSCAGAADGGLVVTVQDGTAPYTYSWSNGAADAAITALAPGDYSVTVTDANGCSAVATATITEPAALQATINGTEQLCTGAATGTLTASVEGGTGVYTYLWNMGATAASLSELTAGTYTVTVTDENGCTTTATATIEEDVLVVDLGPDRAECSPASVELSSGYEVSEDYSIVWSTGATEATITVSTTGTYSVTVTENATGCSATDEVLVEIENEFVPTVQIRDVNTISCDDAEIVLEAVPAYGGAAPTFQWYRNGAPIEGETAQTLTMLPEDFRNEKYYNGDNISVVMTSSLSCAEPNVATSADFQVLFPSLSAPVLTSYEESVCFGSPNPTIRSTTGTRLNWYTFPSNTPVEYAQGVVDFTPTNTNVGMYMYYAREITEFCGESAKSREFTLTIYQGDCEPTGCEVNPTVTIDIQPSEAICSDITSVQLEASLADIGENPQYAWYFNNETAPFSTEASPVFSRTTGFTTGDVFRLEVTITDEAFICEDNTTITDVASITIVPEMQATVSIRPIEPVCAESTTPVILYADGDYIDWRFADMATLYQWYIGSELVKEENLTNDNATAAQLEIIPNQLPADAQIRLVVTLPEGTSCVLPPAETTYTVPFVSPGSPAVTLSSSAPDGVCPGTAVTFTATATNAGTAPAFTFLVDGAEVQSGTSASYVLAAPQNGQQVVVKVTANNADGLCLASTEATSAPQSVRVLTTEECVGGGFNCGVFGAKLTSFVRPSCGERNGALYYEISGGAKSYFIRYSFAGEVVEQVVNEDSFVLAIERIPAGQVDIYIRDSRGRECSLTTILEQEPSLSITLTKVQDVQCYGESTGSVRLDVESEAGSAPYQFLREGSTTWETLNGNSMPFENLPAGIFNILVRKNESDNCPDVASVEILNLNTPIEIEYTITAQANCNDNIGAFTLDRISGGSQGNGYRVKLASEDNFRDFVPGMVFNSLGRGRQVLVISDGVCQTNKTIVVPSPGLIALSEESRTIDFSCEQPELRNGLFLKIDTEITEVAGPYVADIYMMNSAGTYDLIASEEIFNGNGELYRFYLERGNYQVEVRSQNREGCPEVREFVIEGSEIPVPITFEAEAQDIYCADAVGGVLIKNLQGAPGLPYEVEIYDANQALVLSETITTFEYATEEEWLVSGLAEGIYTMFIKQDQSLCNTIETSKPFALVIRETDRKLEVTVMGTTVSFPERATGTLSFRVTTGSGAAPYTADLVWKERVEGQEDWMFEAYGDQVPYNATTGKYDYSYSNLPPGVYELTVYDAKGCSVVIPVTINPDTNVFVPNIITPNGDGKNEVFYIRNKVAGTHVIITNRWGKIVYESKDYKNDWSAEGLAEGIYFYSVKMPKVENGALKGWLEIRRGGSLNQ